MKSALIVMTALFIFAGMLGVVGNTESGLTSFLGLGMIGTIIWMWVVVDKQ